MRKIFSWLRRVVLAWCIFLCGETAIGGTTVLYVNKNAPSTSLQNGVSWGNAYRELRDALNSGAAGSATAANPVEIWTAKGVYKPTDNADRNATFILHSYVRILGGFAGYEESDRGRSFRNIAVLSGDIGIPQRDVISPENVFGGPHVVDGEDPGALDNSFNVLYATDATGVVLDMVAVVSGLADAVGSEDDATPARIDNMATPKPGKPYETIEPLDHKVAGGGIFFVGKGGAVGPTADLVLNQCILVDNSTAGYGGAIALVNGFARIVSCTFQNNYAGVGGAFWGYASHVDFFFTELSDNIAVGLYADGDAGDGGAIRLQTPVSAKSLNLSDELSALDVLKFSEAINRQMSGPQKRIFKTTEKLDEGKHFTQRLANWVDKMYRKWKGYLPPRTAPKAPAFKPTTRLGKVGMWTQRAASAYGIIQDIVLAGDITSEFLVHGFGVSTNDAVIQGWQTFSDGFNLYATPEGWATLVAIEATPPPTREQMALMIKTQQNRMYNQTPPSMIRNCRFFDNEASDNGGAISHAHDNVHIEGCEFNGNHADNAGAISSEFFTTSIIMSSSFLANFATNGHSVIANGDHVRAQIVNCTLEGNSSSNDGYAIGNEGGTEARIFNCILWDNSNVVFKEGGADIFTTTRKVLEGDADAIALYNNAGGAYGNFVAICDLRNSIVQGLGSIDEGTDLIPLFKEGDNFLIGQANIDAAIANRAKADETGQFEAYGFFNIGEGFRPGTKTSRHNSSADPKLFDGVKIANASPAVNAGNGRLMNNNAIGTVTGADVFLKSRFVGDSIDIGAMEFQGETATSVLRVTPQGSGAKNGQTWADAMTLQQALSVTNAEIWVAAGTYLPTKGTDRNATFQLATGVRVYGGFRGGEQEQSARDFNQYPTTLSGNIGNAGDDSDNSFHIVTSIDTSTNTVLDGFTITKGSGEFGAGLYMVNSGMTVRNCKFTENRAQGEGAAAFAVGLPGIVMSNCEFTDNHAVNGGAVFTRVSTMRLENCVFKRNDARTGGAISIFGSDVSIFNGLFVDNSVSGAVGSGSVGGGAIYIRESRNVVVVNCTLVGNSAQVLSGSAQGGGGIDAATSESWFRIYNSILWKNTVVGSSASVEAQQLYLPSIPQYVFNSLVQGLSKFTAGGNIGSNPLFTSEDAGDYTLTEFSPAIDKGRAVPISNFPLRDLAGGSRQQSVDVDMGAYEFPGIPKSLSFIVKVNGDCVKQELQPLIAIANVKSYQWYVDPGAGFVPVTNDSVHSGATASKLTLTVPPTSMNGYKYKLVGDPVYASDPVTLKVRASPIYVNINATGNNTGTNWANAYTNLQDAIDAAGPCTDIWVAKGTYTPIGTSTNDAFHLAAGVSLLGGFAGTEKTDFDRKPFINPTILNGDRGGGTHLRNVIVNDGTVPGIATNIAIVGGFTIIGSTGPLVANTEAYVQLLETIFVTADGVPHVQNTGSKVPSLIDCIVERVPLAVCAEDAGATFSVTNLNGVAATFAWEVDSGSGFVPIASQPDYAGIFQVTETPASSTLALFTIPKFHNHDDFRFRIAAAGYASPGVDLDFNPPTLLFVNSTAVGANNGTSWANAYTNLSDAIATAAGCTEIWVAEGTYRPSADAQTFRMKSGVALYGGFAGTETDINQRHWKDHPTYLAARDRNSVVYASGDDRPVNQSAILDGFVFSDPGAIILVNVTGQAAPTIQNCFFTENQSPCIWNLNGNPRIVACEFVNNTQGVILNRSAGATIVRCLFVGNNTTNTGCAISSESSAITISDCEFLNNNSSWGAVNVITTGTMTIDRSIFRGNRAENGGGALFVGTRDAVMVKNSLFVKNSAGFHGGAISHNGSNLTLLNCTVADNTGLYSGGGLYSQGTGLIIQNSILWNNRLGYDSTQEKEQFQLDVAAGTLSLNASILQDLKTFTNINSTAFNPLFMDPAANDYTLSSRSPAIDNGSPAPAVGALDLAQNPRVFGGQIDRGAYEAQTAPAGTLSLFTLPASKTVCSETEAQFVISGSTNATYVYEWEVDSGKGFSSVSGPEFSIVTADNRSTLTIASALTSMSGTKFRVRIGTYTSPAVELTVLPPTILMVRQHDGATVNGMTWGTAFKTINDALQAADQCTEIWVAAGTYDNQETPLNMKAGVRIFGGFSGTETNRVQRDWTLNRVILKSSPGFAVIQNNGTLLPVDRASVLDGFMFPGGEVGIVNNSADPTIRNCTFENFTGNAIFNGYSASPLIENCVFRNNSDSALFSFNSVVFVNDCVFDTNTTDNQGAAIYSSAGALTVNRTQFRSSVSSQNGGAIFGLECKMAFSRCEFRNGRAYHGAAISGARGTLQVDNSLFYANTALRNGGSLQLDDIQTALRNCTLVENAAGLGGGIYQVNGSIAIFNSILWNNKATARGATAEQQQIFLNSGDAGISFSDVQGLNSFAGDNNRDNEPVFANAPAGDFALGDYSPLIGAGTNIVVAGAFDLIGHDRIQGAKIDLGAYEHADFHFGPLLVKALPTSQNVCFGSDAAFVIQNSPGTGSNFVWQIKRTGDQSFLPIPNDGFNSVEVTSDSSRLVVRNTDPTMTGWRYRFDDIGSGYRSPEYVLTVTLPGVFYVDINATAGAHDGTSWANAHTNLEAALSGAGPCTEIWVAKGTYVPTGFAFQMGNEIKLLGGFKGIETQADQRNWTTNETILIGSASAPTIYNSSDLRPADRTAILDGFTVRGANGNFAMSNFRVSPTIRNCRFTQNTAFAVVNTEATARFENCSFLNNTESAVVNTAGAPEFYLCNFIGNSSSGSGAAIYNLLSSPVVENCWFENNSSASDGGAIFDSHSGSTIRQSTFRGNFATIGGAFSADSSNSSLVNCLFVRNNSQFGGAAMVGGTGDVRFVNCTLTENTASRNGGGIAQFSGVSHVFNSILWNNSDQAGSGQGSELFLFDGSRVVANSCVEGWTGAADTIPFDPLFTDIEAGDYRPIADSPVIDIGDDAQVAGITVDLAGADRIQRLRVDAGAYESALGSSDPARLVQSPRSAKLCAEDVAVFHVVVDPNVVTATFNWEYNTGGDWTPFLDLGSTATGPAAGNYTIAKTSHDATLTVADITASMNGYKFRAHVISMGIITSPAILNVASPGIIFVNANALAAGDGNSWATAYQNLGSALASVSGCRRIIWIAAGEYPTASPLTIPEATEIFGGFAGSETNLNQRDWIPNPAIISGPTGSGAAVLRFEGTDGAAMNRSVLDSVVVSGGDIGADAFRSSPTIRNCVFRNNGVALNMFQSDALVEHSQFLSNTNRAIVIDAGSPALNYLTVAGNLGGDGAAINITRGIVRATSPTVLNCLVIGNVGGGIKVEAADHATILNSTIAGNFSAQPGAGISDYSISGSVGVTNCILWDNRSTGASIQASQFYSLTPNRIDVWYSAVEEMANSLDNHNSIENPLFAAALPASSAPFFAGDYRLQDCSALIDKGNGFQTGTPATDLDGNPRVFGLVVDPGAFEVQAAASPSLAITTQPNPLTSCASATNSFTVVANGADLTYRWERNANDGLGFIALNDNEFFSGATTPALTVLAAPRIFDGHQFRCIVTSSAGCHLATRAVLLTVRTSRLFVNAAAPAGGDGTSWATALRSVSAALTSPQLDLCDSEIWVAAGIYNEPQLSIYNGVRIYGGFAGDETDFEQRDAQANPTVLHATGNYLFYRQATKLITNVTQVVEQPDPVDAARIDGLILENAAVTAIALLKGASPTIANSEFRNNHQALSISGSAPLLQNCRITSNQQAIFLDSPDVQQRSEPKFLNCRFQANVNGVILGRASNITLENCLVSGNVGEAMLYFDGVSLIARNCTITGNNGRGCKFLSSEVEMYNSIVWNNRYLGLFDEAAQIFRDPPFGTFIQNDIQNADIFAFGQNFSIDPMFVQSISVDDAPTTAGDFSLSLCSPVINRGLNANAPATDILGNPRIAHDVADLGAFEFVAPILRVLSQSGDQTGSFSSPVQFTVASSVPDATYQWQYSIDGGIYFGDVFDDLHHSGARTPTLTLTDPIPEMDGYIYVCRISGLNCQVFTTRAIYHHVNAGVGPFQFAAATNAAPLEAPITFDFYPNLNADSASTASAVIHGFESGSGVDTVSISGITISLRSRHLAGERISVSATSGLEAEGGYKARPFVREFRAAVPNANSMEFIQETLPTSGSDLAVGDFNADGRPDLVVVGPSGARVWFNDGSGVLNAGPLLAASATSSVRAADLNNDGRLDVVLLGADGSISIWLNFAGGFVQNGSSLRTGAASFALGDLNGDGRIDLLRVDATNAQVWLNGGGGVLFESDQHFGNAGIVSADLGDLNSDGTLDAALVYNGAQTNEVWLNNLPGGFIKSTQSLGTGGERVDIAAISGNWYPDVLISSSSGAAQLWQNDGNGNLKIPDDATKPGDPVFMIFQNVYLGYNPEKAIDDNPSTFMYSTFQPSQAFVVTPSAGSTIINGIRLTSTDASFLASDDPDRVEIEGSNDDGAHYTMIAILDPLPVFPARRSTITVSFTNTVAYKTYRVTLRNTNYNIDSPRVQIAEVALLRAPLPAGRILALADLNADGYLDACIAQPNGELRLWLTSGKGTWASSTLLGTNHFNAIAAADLDHNGALSLVAIGSGATLRNVNLVADGDATLPIPTSQFTNVFAAFRSAPLSKVRFLSTPHGTLQIGANPIALNTDYDLDSLAELQFAPDLYFHGMVRLNWRGASADNSAAETNTLTLNLRAIPHAPVAGVESIALDRGGSTNALVGGATSVLANDFDPDGDTMTLSLNINPAHGSLILNPDGTFLYQHDGTQTDTDSFTYLLTDSTGLPTAATVNIAINLFTSRPTADAQTLLTQAGLDLPITLTASDPENDPLTFTVRSDPVHGQLTGTPPDLTYTPAAGFAGTDSFTFDVFDGLTNSAPVTVSIFVNAAPVVQNLSLTITNFGPTAVTLIASDTNNDALAFTISVPPAHGELTGSSSNRVYQQTINYFGDDSFTFVVEDGRGGVATGVVSIAIVSNNKLVVTNAADSGPATLREVLNQANATPGPWTIEFAATLTNQTILLSTVGDSSFGDSALTVSNEVIVAGETAPGLRIARDPSSPEMRLLRVAGGAKLTLRDLILSGGLARGGNGSDGWSGGGGGGGFGGAILNEATLQIQNLTFRENQSIGGAGGAPLSVLNGGAGGGINGGAGGIQGAAGGAGGFGGGGGGAGTDFFTRPATAGFGGGVGGGYIPTAPTASGGAGGFGGGSGGMYQSAGGGGAGLGGAIFNHGGTLHISASTFETNSTAGGSAGPNIGLGFPPNAGHGYGGAVFNYNGTLTVEDTTMTGNIAENGGALFNVGDDAASSVQQLNVTYNNPAATRNVAGTALNGGTSTIDPMFELDANVNYHDSVAIQILPPESTRQITAVTQGAIGSVTFDTHSLTYTNTGPRNQNDSFTLTVQNGAASYLVTVYVNVIQINNPPIAKDITLSAYRGYRVRFSVSDSISDPDGDPVELYTVSSDPSAQVIPISPNITYTQRGALAAVDNFNYIVRDSLGLTATGKVTVNFLPFTLAVTNAADSGPGTLREAMVKANTPAIFKPQTADDGPIWNIQFDPSLAGQTILLSTVGDSYSGVSALGARYSVTIDGSAAPGLTIARDPAAGPMQLLVVVNGFLKLENLTLRDGIATGNEDFGVSGLGAAVGAFNSQLTVTNVTFTNNVAIGLPGPPGEEGGWGLGGAIYSADTTLNIENCRFLGNSVTAGPSDVTPGRALGGAIYNTASGFGTESVITRCEFSENHAEKGEAIFNDAYNSAILFLSLNESTVRKSAGSAPESKTIEAETHDNGSIQFYTWHNVVEAPGAPWIFDLPDLTIHVPGSAVIPLETIGTPVLNFFADDQSIIPDQGLHLTGAASPYSLEITPSVADNDTFLEIDATEGSILVANVFDVTVIVNHPPTGTNVVLECPVGQEMKVSDVQLIAAFNDPDADPLHLDSFDITSVNGGSIRKEGHWLIYHPDAGPSPDSFEFTIADPWGGKGSARVMITKPPPSTEVTPNALQPKFEGPDVIVRFAGIPGVTYEIQFSLVAGPPWTALGTVVARPDGLIEFRDPAPGDPMRFYRTFAPIP